MQGTNDQDSQSIRYRPVDLGSDDLKFIASIDVTIPAEFDPRFSVDDKAIEHRLETLRKSVKEDSFFDVAVNSENQIVGFHFVVKGKDMFGESFGHIHTLWVEGTYQKQGIARTLKVRAEDWAKKEKLSYLVTNVNAQNKSMQSLNESLGYETEQLTMKKKI